MWRINAIPFEHKFIDVTRADPKKKTKNDCVSYLVKSSHHNVDGITQSKLNKENSERKLKITFHIKNSLNTLYHRLGFLSPFYG